MVHSLGRKTITIAAVIALAITGMFMVRSAPAGATSEDAKAFLHDASGNEVGLVKFEQQGDKVLVKVTASVPTSLAGFHGFHVHSVGVCTATAFTSAGGHFGHNSSDPASTPHGTHPGDMPSLLVNDDGTAEARFLTDGFSVADVVGRAVIMHAGADNFANIPTRYGTADATTLGTGDAGARYACGVIG
jgi:superoxide dismutase, Cu-Zn family